MTVMGIDLGDTRTGVAFSDPTGLLAGQPQVIVEKDRARLIERLVSLIREKGVQEVALGLPRNMHPGRAGPAGPAAGGGAGAPRRRARRAVG